MVFTGNRGFTGAAIIVAALLCSACLPTLPLPSQATAANSQSTTAAANTGTIRIGKAVRGDLTGVVTFAAPLQTKGQVAVVPRVTATLNKVSVDVGSRVRAGDTLAELDHADLDERVLAAQAAQASAEAKLAQLKAGPKPEVLAAAQANFNAAQARVKMLQSTRDNADAATLDQRVKDARTALDQAQAALQPDAAKVAQAQSAADAAHQKLTQLQSDPTKANDKTALDTARADSQKADDALAKARTPTGTQTAVTTAQRELQDAQQAQLIARLSTTAFDLDQARALLDVADAQLKLANAPATPEEIKAVEAAVEEAFSQAELARARVRDTTITAPIAGIVTEIKATIGSSVGPSAAIVTLIPPDMQVVVDVDEGQLGQVQVGQNANLSVESFPRDAFTGTVKAIAPVLDPRTRTAVVQVDVPDPQGKLKPGMFTQLAIQLGQRQGALMVPKEAVVKMASVDPLAPLQNVIYTVASGRVHKQIVSTGVSDGKNIEILQGVQEGIDLVLNPRADFLEGELITST
jgi:multidrug efflux pump subunit AcrA (membrane-fusion protein)